jgi:hypothetical protein
LTVRVEYGLQPQKGHGKRSLSFFSKPIRFILPIPHKLHELTTSPIENVVKNSRSPHL